MLVRCFPHLGHSTEEQLHTKNHTVSEMGSPPAPWACSSHSPSTAFHSPQGAFTVRVQRKGAKTLPRRQMLEILTNSSRQLWNKCAPMPPLFWRCWIFPLHFQTFSTYFWTSSFFGLNPTLDTTDNPLKTISISKKPSRIRIVRSKREYAKFSLGFWHPEVTPVKGLWNMVF